MAIEITTSRLRLREFRPGDWRAVHAFGSDPEVMRYMLAGDPFTERRSRAYVAEAIAWAKEVPRTNYGFAITLLASGQLIGGCRLGITDRERREADVGYGIHRSYWNQGYGTEALRALLEFGFGELGLSRIVAEVVAANARSIRVLQKAGMKPEAEFRDRLWFDGRWWDSYRYALTSEEWKAVSRGHAGASSARGASVAGIVSTTAPGDGGPAKKESLGNCQGCDGSALAGTGAPGGDDVS